MEPLYLLLVLFSISPILLGSAYGLGISNNELEPIEYNIPEIRIKYVHKKVKELRYEYRLDRRLIEDKDIKEDYLESVKYQISNKLSKELCNYIEWDIRNHQYEPNPYLLASLYVGVMP